LVDNFPLHITKREVNMETKTICLTLPIGVFSALKKTPEEFARGADLLLLVPKLQLGNTAVPKLQLR
jgi:hypothetical protein